MDALEPLASDAYRSDPSAPCHYWHLKLAALNSGWDKLTDEERAFVGVEVNEHARPRDGWRSPIALVIDRLGGQMPRRTYGCSSGWRVWTRRPKSGSSSSVDLVSRSLAPNIRPAGQRPDG
jgi:hypothetical protein